MNTNDKICRDAEHCPSKRCPHVTEHQDLGRPCELLFCSTIESHTECGPVVEEPHTIAQ